MYFIKWSGLERFIGYRLFYEIINGKNLALQSKLSGRLVRNTLTTKLFCGKKFYPIPGHSIHHRRKVKLPQIFHLLRRAFPGYRPFFPGISAIQVNITMPQILLQWTPL